MMSKLFCELLERSKSDGLEASKFSLEPSLTTGSTERYQGRTFEIGWPVQSHKVTWPFLILYRRGDSYSIKSNY